MDITKWKSMAIRKNKWLALKGLCSEKYRAPASMWEKIFDDYVGFQAKKKNITFDKYMEQLIEKGKRK
jgi:hypothetical protein